MIFIFPRQVRYFLKHIQFAGLKVRAKNQAKSVVLIELQINENNGLGSAVFSASWC